MAASGETTAISKAVLASVLKIVALIFVGVHLERKGILNAAKRKCLSALAMDVCLPCLLFSAVLPEANADLLVEGWPLLLVPVAYALVGAVLGALCCLLAGVPKQQLGAAAACAAFPNVNGFPVSVITALGDHIPKSDLGFSALVFLSVIQLTDGVIKYTLGPAVFRHGLRLRNQALKDHIESSCKSSDGDNFEEAHLPLGDSLHSIKDSLPRGRATSLDDAEGGTQEQEYTEFGLSVGQIRTVKPEWSRYDGYKVWSWEQSRQSMMKFMQPLLPDATPETSNSWKCPSRADIVKFLRTLFPPQVVAVLLGLALGMAPSWIKELLVRADSGELDEEPLLGWVFGTAKELGKGFVPMQMISLGGRMLNVVSDSGPLAVNGSAGPKGRSKLLRIAAAVGVARMMLAPVILLYIARAYNKHVLLPQGRGRPLAFWAPALIVFAMPTANNMSTMADLIGFGRSVAAASTAVQLLVSPILLVVTLTFLISRAAEELAV